MSWISSSRCSTFLIGASSPWQDGTTCFGGGRSNAPKVRFPHSSISSRASLRHITISTRWASSRWNRLQPMWSRWAIDVVMSVSRGEHLDPSPASASGYVIRSRVVILRFGCVSIMKPLTSRRSAYDSNLRIFSSRCWYGAAVASGFLYTCQTASVKMKWCARFSIRRIRSCVLRSHQRLCLVQRTELK